MEEKDFSDYLAAFKRHRTAFTVIFAGLAIVSILTALLLPPVFRATATILIEEQEIPAELVRSTITSYAAQRLQTISQRVMTRANLLNIIEKFELYAKERRKESTDDVLEKMRKDIAFETVSADVIDPRSGRPTQATIAFTLSYDGVNPDLVQRVTNEITSLYLEENLRNRTQKVAEASDFLTSEVEQVGALATELERSLAKFKAENLNALPEQKQFNIQLMERIDDEMRDIDRQIRTMKERNFYLDSEIAQIPPESAIMSSTGERILSPSDRLKSLRTEYLSLVAKYSSRHPDVIKIRQEMESLGASVGAVDSSLDALRELEHLRGERASLAERYSEGHPDIQAIDKRMRALESSIKSEEIHEQTRSTAKSHPDNPAYINLVAQREANNVEIAGLTRRFAELQAKHREYEFRIQKSPDVERQYLALVRDQENTSNRYRELKAKQMEAQIAEQLEKKSKGERFSVIEPPSLPEKPIKPNRLAITILGMILATACSAGYVLARETLDRSVRKVKQIVAIAGAPPLAVVPYLPLEFEIEAHKRRSALGIVLTFAGIAIVLLLIHFLWIPLDVLWFRVARKLESLLG